MGVRSAAAVALLAVALLGFTVAIPQDAHLGLGQPLEDFFGGGVNVGVEGLVGGHDPDLGRLLKDLRDKRIDPALLANLDPKSLADALEHLTPEQLKELGLDRDAALAQAALLRDPNLGPAAYALILAGLAAKGLGILAEDGNGTLVIDRDHDGKLSQGDVRAGSASFTPSNDDGLDDQARSDLAAYQAAGGLGLDRPATATNRNNATAATAPLGVPGYPSDRATGPYSPVCVQAHSLQLTCHLRTFVQSAVRAENDYTLFLLDAGRTSIPLETKATGPQASTEVTVLLDAKLWTPIPALTPNDHLVGLQGPPIQLARDGNGMVWARAAKAGPATLDLTWAVDAAYYDLAVPADASFGDVPEAMRPALDARMQALGVRVAEVAGAQQQTYAGTIGTLVGFFRGFQGGALPTRAEVTDDVLASAQSRIGCARQRAEAFTLAAQALGIPAHLVVNEAHAFSEVYVPRFGWRMADLGGCGAYQVAPRPSFTELRVQQDLPYAGHDAPQSEPDPGAAPAATAIAITQSPSSLKRGSDFALAGQATAGPDQVPAGIPITFTYNRTKATPGTAFCATVTQTGGRFQAVCRLAADTPSGNLQLVARLAPTVLAGKPAAASWSDPPFTVQKATALAVAGPLVVRATDEDGLPLAGRLLHLDGAGGDGARALLATDASGFVRLPFPGTVRFDGDDAHEPAALDVATRPLATAKAAWPLAASPSPASPASRVEPLAAAPPVLAVASASQAATVLGLILVLLLLLGFGAVLLAQAVQRRRALRDRFLPPPLPCKVRIVRPELPGRTPRVVDPEADGDVTVRVPGNGPWRVQDGDGAPLDAKLVGRFLTFRAGQLPPGAHRLRFLAKGQEEPIELPLTVLPLRRALDGATRDLMSRLGQPTRGPVPLAALEEGLRSGRAWPEDANVVRRCAEAALYDGLGCTRERFNGYFLALDAAQARRPA
jgi:hypothetical protein